MDARSALMVVGVAALVVASALVAVALGSAGSSSAAAPAARPALPACRIPSGSEGARCAGLPGQWMRGWIAAGGPAMMEIDPGRRSRPIMLPTVAGTPVVWSSDGTKLLVSDGPRLKVVDLGGRETVAVRNAFPGGASFTPDGRHVVYADEHLGLREVSIHGGPARAITPRSSQPPGTGRIDPVVSPDGTRIAYRRVLGRRFIQGIWVMNRDGTQRHVLVSPARLGRLSGELAVDQIANICWSPDGSRLAFTAGTGNGYRGGVFTVNSDGGGLRRLTPLAAGMWGATWSPDGKRIASMDSSKEVITMSADGTHTRDLGYRALTWSSLAWNPAQRVMTPPHH